MPANYLFKISTTGNISGGKLVRVLYDENESIEGHDTPVDVIDAFEATVISSGPGKRTYSFTALVQQGSAATGYATLADVRGWFSNETPATDLLKVQDMEAGTVYDMVLANKGEFRPVALQIDRWTSGAWWKVPIVLKQQ